MIDRQLEKNFQNTFVTATTVRSQLITVEALLLELLSNGDRITKGARSQSASGTGHCALSTHLYSSNK